MLKPKRIIGPLFTDTIFKDVKDPCIIFDGTHWHIYGSGGDVRNEKWQILHAVSDSIEGPWKEVGATELIGVRGDHVAAPSVLFDEGDRMFHMMVQTEFTSVGGTVEYLTSSDGHVFRHVNTALHSIPDSLESGIYDPHQCVIDGDKYIVYAGTPAIEGSNNQYIIQPDIFLTKSETNEWGGPWKRKGKILDHEHIEWHHNARHHLEYEWGIEGPQILPLGNGKILLNATCFLSEGKFGTRQRVFFALGEYVLGPYRSIGPILDPLEGEEWGSGENGHATAIMHDGLLYLFFQARSRVHAQATENNWRYGTAVYSIEDIEREYTHQRRI